MDTIRLSFPVSGSTREILIARLSEAGCEAFEETDELLHAFLPADSYDAEIIARIARESEAELTSLLIAPENWNATWEAGFRPVSVPGFCTVRAAFHEPDPDIPYDIIITPKMSFGTGHHATTRLMMQAMSGMDFAARRVLDFGTGTGILAILAKKLGAAKVLAVDNDTWSVENAAENAVANGTSEIQIIQGSLEAAGTTLCDIILANINRHILLQYMSQLSMLLKQGGQLLLSGILTTDEEMITASAGGMGLIKKAVFQEGDWIAISFTA